MLALKMHSGWITVSWGIEGVLILVLALACSERSFRLTGMVVLLLCIAKVFALDFWGLETRDKFITVIIAGVAVSSFSFLFIKYNDRIRQYL
jgi:TRAP-type mannitol/chloroaromatic compound transport system permease large subunit